MRVDGSISFSYFIFPFAFDPKIFLGLLDSIEALTWAGKRGPYVVWRRDQYPTEELLPHVSRYLNSTESIPTACTYTMQEQALTAGQLGHICYQGQGNYRWTLMTRQGDIDFSVKNVRLCLFQTGIGFLVINTKPFVEHDSVDAWTNFLHYFRFAKGHRSVRIQGQASRSDEFGRPCWKPNFASLSENEESRATGIGTFYEIIEICLRSIHPGPVWWEELFIDGQLLPYAVLFLQDVDDADIPMQVYRLRNFHHAAMQLKPSPENLDFANPALLPYGDRQWFTFSLEGGTFLSFSPLDTVFSRSTLPEHLGRHYFLVYLMALQQRFSLMKFSEQVARQWVKKDDLADPDQEAAFEQLQSALLSFMARGYFAQVMQREHHHRCFKHWQETLQIERLFTDTHRMVSDMHRYLEARKSRRMQELTELQNQQIQREAEAAAQMEKQAQERAQKLEKRLSAFALVLGLPALGLTFLQSSGLIRLPYSLMTLVSSILLGVVLYLFMAVIKR